ncbi:cupin domain-containing protein [Bdellovibrionota bacterium]
MKSAEQIIKLLNLKPHPTEGGYFTESYRSKETQPDGRSLSTAIYYLLTPNTFSALHRLRGDEIWHFYFGDPIEMLQLHPNGEGKILIISNEINETSSPQVLVPAGVWQGSRLRQGGKLALLGTTMAPGFEFKDYEAGSRTELIKQYPNYSDLIKILTI